MLSFSFQLLNTLLLLPITQPAIILLDYESAQLDEPKVGLWISATTVGRIQVPFSFSPCKMIHNPTLCSIAILIPKVILCSTVAHHPTWKSIVGLDKSKTNSLSHSVKWCIIIPTYLIIHFHYHSKSLQPLLVITNLYIFSNSVKNNNS